MTLKKLKIIDVFLLFGLSFLFHFAYEKIPNTFTSIIFPVNESIWEHMKLIYTPLIFTILTDFIMIKIFHLNTHNLIFSAFYSSIICILVYLIIYLPIDHFLGHSIIFAIILLFLIFILSQIISYHLMTKEQACYLQYISIFLIAIVYIIFAIFTYCPPKHHLFYDTQAKTYGIKK